jgi:hypothetical protein
VLVEQQVLKVQRCVHESQDSSGCRARHEESTSKNQILNAIRKRAFNGNTRRTSLS